MKLKRIMSCFIAAIIIASLSLPGDARATGTNEYLNSVTDKDRINQYAKDLGEMKTVIKTAELTQAQSASVTKLDLEWKAGTIYVKPTNGKSIKITQKGYRSQNKSEQVVYELEKGSLKIRDGRKKIEMFNIQTGNGYIITSPGTNNSSWMFNGNDRKNMQKEYDNYRKKMLYNLIIEVPKKEYDKLEFKSEFASLSIKDMKIKEAKSDSVTGIVQYENCTIQEIRGETVNGSINPIDCIADNVELNTVNGDLWVYNSTINEMQLETVNGDILVQKKVPVQKFTLSAVNGDIRIAPKQFPAGFSRDFKASVVNGDIVASLPPNKGFYIPKKNLGNGDIHSEFKFLSGKGNYVYGDGKFLLDLSCANGDITINKAD